MLEIYLNYKFQWPQEGLNCESLAWARHHRSLKLGSRLSYLDIDYSGHNFTDLFNFNDITADKDSSNPDNENDSQSNESEND